MSISTQDLSLLPDMPTLYALSQSLALLDAIIMPEWERRYYSFNAHWRPNAAMASMRNGEGDEYFCLFCPYGVALKGFAPHARMSPYGVNPPRLWDGLFENFPPQLSEFISEPAFIVQDTTFCIWRTFEDSVWQVGSIQFPDQDDPDGSAWMLRMLDGDPTTYQQWAEEYYEVSVDPDAIIHIYEHQPLNESVVAALNPQLSLEELTADVAEIGYNQGT